MHLVNPFYQYLMLFSLFFIASVHASVIDVSGNHPSGSIPIIITGEESDKLLVPAPNQYGFSQISLNKLHLDKPLKLINAVSLNPLLVGKAEPTTIVLELSSTASSTEIMKFSSGVQLVGKPADLIIVSRGLEIDCTSCSFDGFPRITMSTGIYGSEEIFDSLDSETVKEEDLEFTLWLHHSPDLLSKTSTFLINTREGKLNINGLSAPGTVFFDLLASELVMSGDISTNLNGKVDSSIGVVIDPLGDKRIASGIVQIHAGSTRFDYFNAAITEYDTSVPASISSVANISTGSIQFHNHNTNGSILFDNSTVSTLADYSMLNLYQGKSIVSDGVIRLEAGNNITAINSTLKFDIALDVTSGSMSVDKDSTIGADYKGDINLSIAEGFLNLGIFEGKSLNLVAGRIENEGDLLFEKDFFIESKTDIDNRFGGLMAGSQVLLKATNMIANGSYYPYRFGCPPFQYCATSSSIKDVKPYEAGFLYSSIMDHLPIGAQSYSVPTLQATILGDNVELSSFMVANVNPYYELNNEYIADMEGALDPILSDQVVISANNNLTIQASNIVNVSSIIESVDGELAILGNYIENQRYQVRVDTFPGNDLPENFCEEFQGCAVQSNTVNVITDNLVQYAQYYSPAGRLYSGRRALFVAESRMLNELSYVEVHGDLDAELNNFLQLGYAYHNVVNINAVTTHSKRVCRNKVFGKCISRRTVTWQTEEPHQEGFLIGEIPTLFSVEGYVTGIGEGELKSVTESYLNTLPDGGAENSGVYKSP
mgnify:CR=1 FL=1